MILENFSPTEWKLNQSLRKVCAWTRLEATRLHYLPTHTLSRSMPCPFNLAGTSQPPTSYHPLLRGVFVSPMIQNITLWSKCVRIKLYNTFIFLTVRYPFNIKANCWLSYLSHRRKGAYKLRKNLLDMLS